MFLLPSPKNGERPKTRRVHCLLPWSPTDGFAGMQLFGKYSLGEGEYYQRATCVHEPSGRLQISPIDPPGSVPEMFADGRRAGWVFSTSIV